MHSGSPRAACSPKALPTSRSTLFAFTPSLIANFSVVTTDGIGTLFIFLVAFQLVRWRNKPNWLQTVLHGNRARRPAAGQVLRASARAAGSAADAGAQARRMELAPIAVELEAHSCRASARVRRALVRIFLPRLALQSRRRPSDRDISQPRPEDLAHQIATTPQPHRARRRVLRRPSRSCLQQQTWAPGMVLRQDLSHRRNQALLPCSHRAEVADGAPGRVTGFSAARCPQSVPCSHRPACDVHIRARFSSVRDAFALRHRRAPHSAALSLRALDRRVDLGARDFAESEVGLCDSDVVGRQEYQLQRRRLAAFVRHSMPPTRCASPPTTSPTSTYSCVRRTAGTT